MDGNVRQDKGKSMRFKGARQTRKTGRGNEVMSELRAGSTQLQRAGGRVVALREEEKS